MASILNSIKKPFGIDKDDDTFNADLIMHINDAFMNLHQMGVGPPEGFIIQDDTAEWKDFLSDADFKTRQALESYVYLKVKLVFDPPSGSSAIKVIEDSIKEKEWRLTNADDSAETTE